MPAIRPIKRRELIAYLRALGFEAPVSGGDHQYMKGRGRKLRIPNPHMEDIGRGLLVRILRQGGIDREEWEAL
jgi:predicted RNA binding protein YcfA (HicA-like mRNA interferase family)